jgi:hypothetical protein
MFSPDDFWFLQMTPEQVEEYLKQLSTPEMKRLNVISFFVVIGAAVYTFYLFN